MEKHSDCLPHSCGVSLCLSLGWPSCTINEVSITGYEEGDSWGQRALLAAGLL